MDLHAPSKISNLGGKYYAFVIMNDLGTWVLFLSHKNEHFFCQNFVKRLKMKNVSQSHTWEVITREKLKSLILKPFVVIMYQT